ncbi:hypothetical protein RW64_03205 [Geobacter sulfurreducens]|nr:hypothetical protein RW64_03205 [Geobacter sulfurreducens]
MSGSRACAREPLNDELCEIKMNTFENVDVMPKRDLGRVYHLDANRINARQQDKAVNQLELWHKNGVVFLEMSLMAYDEACDGNACRAEKASDYSWVSTSWEMKEWRIILENILFPRGVKKQNESNDISILLLAKMANATLVTNDGGSKSQPGGIL